jgi:hypothetical protein
MGIKVTGVGSTQSTLSNQFRKLIEGIAQSVREEAVNNTPKKSGYARSQWTKETSDTGFKVENRVPYIERLEKGSSKQAPNGISMPTIRNVKGKYK